ncbi:RtcB family protein [Maridesulfovibrio hydrothermalis]|uniref:tRNA-splicing ligase RtcB n=1 Tax=Maridesulfovibrio hydrothermalis AM13 = DSM 14728 TaxID=1121451 RepID=L0RCX4_9BACT|nr:RtcB family protein [Maridesulfovibrio hydrothermalis]CCO24604.1 tRNA-splicing ligase RtcB [Maridesulfovibrio hydrothermalis AM13 = DSM 14728]
MNINLLNKSGPCRWTLKKNGSMNVDAVFFGDVNIILQLDETTVRQVRDVASLPGVAGPVCVMPDAHSGYGFPIGGVAAFDVDHGVISAGGVGFDISCGVRTLTTGLKRQDLFSCDVKLADALFKKIPAGTGVGGAIHLDGNLMDEMLSGGAAWVVGRKMGRPEDLGRIEGNGRNEFAAPSKVSAKAKQRMINQLGSLGSGNHYLEVQYVEKIFDNEKAAGFGVEVDDVVVSIHCGSRGLGHQIAKDYLPLMVDAAPGFGINLPSKDIACAPINSQLGKDYWGAMGAGINCALANRQVLTHLVRECFAEILPQADLKLIYDVSHNTCQKEKFNINGRTKTLYIHRKGATRALGPGHKELPDEFKKIGQPVIIGGSMGTSSYILAGTDESADLSFSSCCHGAGRTMSRIKARKCFKGKKVQKELGRQGIIIRSGSINGIAEEAPSAYKDINGIIKSTEQAEISKAVARLRPLLCIKG